MRMVVVYLGVLACTMGATVSAAAKEKETVSAPAAQALEPVRRPKDWPPKAGVKTPGVQIPMVSLKAEAEISLSGPPAAVIGADSAYVVTTAGKLVPVDAKTSKPGDAFGDLGKPCGGIVSAFRSLWIPDCAGGSLTRVDTKEKKVSAQIPVPIAAVQKAIAASEDSLWVLSDARTTLSRIDPEDRRVVAELRLPAGCNSVLSSDSSIWITCPEDNKVLRVDPRRNLVSKTIDVPGKPSALAAGEGSIWVLGKAEGTVARIDPKTDKVTATIELKVSAASGMMATGEGAVWVSLPGFPISRIDPSSDEVVQQFAGDGGGSVYVGLSSVWISAPERNMVLRFDPRRIRATLAE